mmetsp:Transcript_8511/g.18531  ORF Transcript_8511/g.18531 Transcript_8511/m.18531 type:complete len:627 (-) Transcript_8511:54-1934(-)
MVICEAARAICDLPGVTVRELTPAITVLQLFLTSPKPTLRFAGVRALNKIAMIHPLSVTACNLDLETMISDSNRSIATLAITTLLKTGSESSVERLMKQISTFMSEIADEFKIVVVEAIRALCIKYQTKHRILMAFLSNTLREEGGFDFKKCIVESIISLIEAIPEAKDAGLIHLCEFIEDCEFTLLSTQILHLLGTEGPKTAGAAKYIRFIYNRVILENATVRAAAVTALAKFGVHVVALRPQILTLLRRCCHDVDDEVRDRATFYVVALDKLDSEHNRIAKYVVDTRSFSVDGVERALLDYKTAANFSTPFDLVRTVALQDQDQAAQNMADQQQRAAAGARGSDAPVASESSPAVVSSMYEEMLNGVPELADCGKLFKSSAPVQLTESESEFLVTCVKHVFPNHIVLQFTIKNTLDSIVLSNANVVIEVDGLDAELDITATVPADEVTMAKSGVAFVCVEWDGVNCPTGEVPCTLTYTQKDCDPATGEVDDGGVDDEYQLEPTALSSGDFVQQTHVADFRKTWDAMTAEFEEKSAFTLPASIKTLQQASKTILDVTGMEACERTDRVSSAAKSHRVLLHGVFIAGGTAGIWPSPTSPPRRRAASTWHWSSEQRPPTLLKSYCLP